MILFHSETKYTLPSKRKYKNWLSRLAETEQKKIGEINYIFCDDEYLLKVNQQYLQHDTYTDIISFDYSEGKAVSGDIMISVERVNENAQKYQVSFDDELLRVMAHGILHFCGYKDKTTKESSMMRSKEDAAVKLFYLLEKENC